MTGLRLRTALLWLCFVTIAGVGADAALAQSAPGKVYLVRHAEPGPGSNPSLNEAGHKRAVELARMLRNAGIAAIFTSPYLRTRETAAPLATALGIAARPTGVERGIDAHIADVAKAVLSHKGGAVFVVGHSNTVPGVIGLLGGGTLPDLCEKTHDLLFTIELKVGATVTQSRFGDPSPPSGPNCL
jgi:phosphohistidine phosphatase SixA